MEMAEDNSRETPLPQALLQGKRMPRRVPVILAAALLVGLFFWRIIFGDFTPEVTQLRLQQAQQAWSVAKMTNYRLEVEVHSAQRERYLVEVQQGIPTQVTRNGTAITQLRTMETWTVPGMLTTIEEDLSQLANQQSGQATKQTPRLRLWCEFDPLTGVPRKYRRLDWDKGHEITWEVTKFESP
jgi:hypothetical protein